MRVHKQPSIVSPRLWLLLWFKSQILKGLDSSYSCRVAALGHSTPNLTKDGCQGELIPYSPFCFLKHFLRIDKRLGSRSAPLAAVWAWSSSLLSASPAISSTEQKKTAMSKGPPSGCVHAGKQLWTAAPCQQSNDSEWVNESSTAKPSWKQLSNVTPFRFPALSSPFPELWDQYAYNPKSTDYRAPAALVLLDIPWHFL